MIADTWGSTLAERSASYPCDAHLPGPHVELFRAVDVDARPEVVFRWLCQLRVAPYSYDWLDNMGRRSPRELTPGVDVLAPGQPVMRIFELVSFAPGEHLTIVLRDRVGVGVFGPIALTYQVVPRGADRARIVVKMRVAARGRVGRVRAAILAWGDLVMMRKQLLTLRSLAESGARA